MPVLSEQMISQVPSVSTAGSFLTRAFFLDIACVPSASVMVTIAGRPSGIAATAREIDVKSMSRIDSRFVKAPKAKMTTAIIKIKTVKTLLRWAMFF